MIIYQFKNKINGKKYIGQTVQKLCNRIYQHIHSMNKGFTRPFYNSLRKYGINQFTIEILLVCESKKQLNEMEKYYINKLNTLVPYGYNVEIGGQNSFITSKGKKQDNEWIKKRTGKRKIAVTGQNIETGEIINFDSIKDASDFLKVKDSSSITKVCNKQQHFAYGYYWKYKQSNEFPFYEKRIGRVKTKTQPKLHKSVVGIDNKGNQKIYKSITETKMDGFDPSSVSACCRNKLKKHKGFTFYYTNENKMKVDI